jgi:hypothetical protein
MRTFWSHKQHTWPVHLHQQHQQCTIIYERKEPTESVLMR